MGSKPPKTTVLMGTYNRPDYLREAITSVVNQSFKDWELLVMNDGGVDVADVVNEFEDSRIRYFNDSVNKGLAARLNFGLVEARGDYIAYLGDDDLYYPNHLQILSQALDEDDAVGAVYSDLYAVQFVKDEATGKRYPLHKFIQVSRDYNRDFMFCFNHTLHVSLVHRRELALRAGGYDENITVLIDWNITRKLSFYTDFKYVPVLTGEYYMPIWKSDRISNLEREDNERYKHNLRKIKADLPPEPWPKADRVAVIVPITKWTTTVVDHITGLTDSICYPVRYILVSNAVGKGEVECRETLGKIGELKNITIYTPPKRMTELEAYRFGAEKADAEYVYLPSLKANTDLEVRIITARGHLSKKECDGVKWDVAREKEGPFDILMKKERFLEVTDPIKGEMGMVVDVVPYGPPRSLEFDYYLHQSKKQFEDGNYELAYSLIKKAEGIRKGGSRNQYLIDLYSKICFALKKFDEAEEKCRLLVTEGYGADNWIRLGKMLQSRGAYRDAIEAYRKGVEEIGLKEGDLDSKVFPISVPEDFGSFTALIGMGECLLEVNSLTEGARVLRRAAKLKANSHRPWLGFGKLFLKTDELEKAEEALLTAARTNGEDPAVYRELGNLDIKKKQPHTAYSYFVKALQQDKTSSEDIDPIYYTGALIEKWGDMKEVFEDFLGHRPGYVPAMKRLSTVYYELGEYRKAGDLLVQAFALEGDDANLKEFSATIQKAIPAECTNV
jgi:tetratricopeptide (TPR) repeat protein